jgi:DNA-binding NtrC family response regulator
MSGNAPILVLIVDDEPLIRWALAETLIAHGCRIVEACDAQSAIDVLTDGSRRFDVVLLDYRLPDAHDLTLLATTRRLSPESHVVVMTAFMTEDVAIRAMELGACHVLQKPVELGALAALVLKAARANSRAPRAGCGD